MTNETQTPNQSNPYYADIDGAIRPLDPISGEIMQPGVIPESLLADEELRRGFTFMREHAASINFTLLLGAHGAAGHFDKATINLHDEAVAVGQAKGVIFLEGVAETDEESNNREASLNMASNMSASEADEYRSFMKRLPNQTFQTETEAELAGTGARVIMPDYKKLSHRPADQALDQWDKYITDKTQPFDSIAKVTEWQQLKLGFVAYRDWYWIGKMGNALAELEDQGLLEESVDARMVAGSAHGNLGKNLETLGVHVTYHGEYGDRLPEGERRFVAAVGNVALTAGDSASFVAQITAAKD